MPPRPLAGSGLTIDVNWPHPIEAVLFDMDGTLLDSEHLTDAAVAHLLKVHDLDLEVDSTAFHGRTWSRAAETLQKLAPSLRTVDVAAELQAEFHRALVETVPPVIAGAPEAVMAAARRRATALVSSSDRESVEHVVARLGLGEHFTHLVYAEDIQRSKPAPQCYEVAARALSVEPNHCLVFEDSIPGLQAAIAAGMYVIGIGTDEQRQAIAHRCIGDFTELAEGFFE